MTWKRVATAVVLIPCVVGLVLWGSTAVVAHQALALVIVLALFEYFRPWRCHRPSRLSILDCDVRSRACLCAMAGGYRAIV